MKAQRKFSYLRATGFSLIELLIVLAILSAVVGVIFASLGEGQTVSSSARDETEMQQELQDVLFFITSELRTAGFPPQSFYEAGYLQTSGLQNLVVAQGIVEADPLSLKFRGDIDNDRQIDQIHYSRGGSSPPYSLRRQGGRIQADGTLPGGPAQNLAEQVQSLQFKYFDSLGAETSNLAEITGIEIHLTLRTKKVDPISQVHRTVSEVVRVRPPNL